MSNYSGMPMPMGPPMIPGYSLRVQLFAPNAHSSSDTPVRCFRVVTSPDATLREFCQEAIRIHAINYGESISIKKCQDDQLFDVTQSDLVGPLFQNAATIRIIQASAVPSIRDSVPPTSALRYDPTSVIGRKRERSRSPILNGSGLSNPWRVNKRQRIPEVDPDEPIPSREQDLGVNGIGHSNFDDYIVPDSQQDDSMILEHGHPARQPSATANLRIPYNESPIRPPVDGAIASAKSATYHISRPAERGTSVSTAATTPLDTDRELELPAQNDSLPSISRKTSDTFSSNGNQNRKSGSGSPNEDSIYDEIPSDREGIVGLRRTKAAMKVRNSPRSGLPGLMRGSNLDTPSTGKQRRSSELPLTPESRTRKEIGGRKNQDNQQNARAAAEATEQRKRESEEAQRVEEREKVVEGLRQEEVEKKKLLAAQEAAEREAERIQKEREEKKAAAALEKKLEAERRKKELEEGKKAAEKRAAAEATQLRKELEEKKAAEKLKKSREKALTLSKRKSVSPESAEPAKHDESMLDEKGDTSGSKAPPIRPQSCTPLIPRGRPASMVKSALKSSSPELSKKSPEVERKGVSLEDQMPFPKRRVSFMEQPEKFPKSPSSTAKAIKSSSPILPIAKVPATTKVAGTPKSTTLNLPSSQTSAPILPGAKVSNPILPGSKASTTKSKVSSQAPLERKSTTPVPPPSASSRSTRSNTNSQKEKNFTPVTKSKIVPPLRSSAKRIAMAGIPVKALERSSPSLAVQSRKSENPSVTGKEKSKSVEPQPPAPEHISISSDEEDSDESESDDNDDLDQKLAPEETPSNRIMVLVPSPVKAVKPDLVIEEQKDRDVEMVEAQDEADDDATQSQDDGDVEMEDRHSSPRESRSPVVFNRHTLSQNYITNSLAPRPTQTARAVSPDPEIASDRETTDYSDDEDDAEDEEEADDMEDEEQEGESESDSEESHAGDVDDQASPKLPRNNGKAPSISSSLPKNQLSRLATQSSLVTPASPSVSKAKAKSHTMTNGASLLSLKKNPGILGNLSSSRARTLMNDKQNPVIALLDEDGLSEDEESSSSTSDDSEDDIPAIPKATNKANSKTTESDDSDSDSDSQNDMSKALNAVARGSSQTSQKKRTSRIAGKDMRGKKTDRLISGYVFGRAP